MRSAKTTSTTYERRSLDVGLNLSDAHSRQPLTASQQRIVERFPALFAEACRRTQFDLEEDFIDEFLALANQSRRYPYERYLLSYSASSAVTMLASYCVRLRKAVALIEPVFDNISSILRREGVILEVLPEELLTRDDPSADLSKLASDLIWIGSPNNPTGSYLDRRQFGRLVEFCATRGKTLVVDCCFRFFCRDMRSWDQYELLKSSGVSFVMIEDTGKTWATAEMKVGMVVCSDDVYPEMYRLHDDLLQCVSPFHLVVLTEFLRDTQASGFEATVLHYIGINRELVQRECSSAVLEPINPVERGATVEWIQIHAPFSGEDLWKALAAVGVYILPGSNFYWHVPSKGQRFVRIALARDPAIVSQAVPMIKRVAAELAVACAT
jgi:aspartate/methionine/tyrosine aminotransferase